MESICNQLVFRFNEMPDFFRFVVIGFIALFALNQIEQLGEAVGKTIFILSN